MINFFTGRQILVRMILLTAVMLLITIGILTIYAVGNPEDPAQDTKLGVSSTLWRKQVIFAVLGLFCIVALNLFKYQWLGPLSYWIYGVVLVLLALLLVAKFLGRFDIEIPFFPEKNYTYRWINPIPGVDIGLQPSEFCKVAYIIALAWYLRFRSNYRKFKGLIGPFVLTLVAMVLILLEPDLGTVMLMLPVLFSMLFIAGAKVRHLVIIMLMAVLISPFLWFKMRPYQRMRISSVLLQNEWFREKVMDSPGLIKILAGSKDSTEAQDRRKLIDWERDYGYQVIHSKRAIASGGMRGYGFRKGPYLRHDYNIKYNEPDPIRLPERQNDFIFAIIAHQFGFAGCMGVLLLYAIIIGCGIEIAWANTEPFGRLITIGIVAMFAVEVIVNVSMTMGLMPITGLTLPFISYGGSSLLVSMIAIGLLNNIGSTRPFSIATNPFEYDKSKPIAPVR